MIRRVLVAIALALGACGDDGDTDVATERSKPTTTSTTAAPAGAPPIVVADESSISLVEGASVEHVGDVEGTIEVAFGDGSGSYAAEVDGALVVLLDGPPAMGVDPGPPGRVVLYDFLELDGRSHALYGVRDEHPEPNGPILLHDITHAERTDLGSGFAIEHHTSSASLRNGVLATSATNDLTEVVEIRAVDGDPDVDRWTPTRDLEYNAPPFISDAVLSPDASTIAWLSGPDHDGVTGEEDVGSWEIVVAGLDGHEQHRIPIDVAGGAIPARLDYDGTRLLVSRRIGEANAPALLIQLDDAAESVTVTELPVAGVATFDG